MLTEPGFTVSRSRRGAHRARRSRLRTVAAIATTLFLAAGMSLGSASLAGAIDAVPAAPASGAVTFTDGACVDGELTLNSFLVTLGEGTTATYSLNGGAPTGIAAGSYSTPVVQSGGYHFVLTGADSSTLAFEHTFVAPPSYCAPPPPQETTYYQVGFYIYKKLDASQPASWPNSGLQTFVASKSGTDWYTTFPAYAPLPPEVCGDGWGVQQDKVATTEQYFQWPTNIQYPVDNIGWPPLYDAKHQELSSLMDVPECDDTEVTPAEPSGSVVQCVDGETTTGSITVGLEEGLVYKIEGQGPISGVVIDPVTSAVTSGLPIGEYLVSVEALPGYTITGEQSWPVQVAVLDDPYCDPTKVIPGDPSGSVAMCVDGTVTTGSITVGFEEGLVYTIQGLGAVSGITVDPVTSAVTSDLPVGQYLVSVSALPGYELDGPLEWPIEVGILTPVDCIDLPDHPVIPTNATATPPVCSDGKGTIVLGLIDGQSFFEGVTYYIDGVEASSSVVSLPPGTYQVTVVADPGNTLDGADSFSVTISAIPASCGDLTTLALTGPDSRIWLFGALALLLAGAVMVAVPRLLRREDSTA